MSGESIRSVNDQNLFAELINHPLVQKVNAQISRQESQATRSGALRHLLSTAIRITPSISEKMCSMSQECGERLNLDLPLDLFVYSSPQFNAACFKPEKGRLYIIFSSAILEAFSEQELRYVMGHEIGHYMYNHHDVPVGYLLNTRGLRIAPQLAMKLFKWSRFAEISADRAGAYCVNDFEVVASSLFKLSSGISEYGLVQFDLKSYLDQIQDLILNHQSAGDSTGAQDWFSTHPLSPLRVKALELYFQSKLSGHGELFRDELEVKVEQALSYMEPDYLEGKTKEAKSLREYFIYAVLAVTRADGDITKDEQKMFREFFGDGIEMNLLDFERISKDKERRTKAVCEEASEFKRMQLIRDLVLIAKADSVVENSERKVLKSICEDLKLEGVDVDRLIEQNTYLD